MDDSKQARVLVIKLIAHTVVLVFSVGAIAFMEWQALQHGIDGTVLTAAIGACAVIIGVKGKEIATVVRRKLGK